MNSHEARKRGRWLAEVVDRRRPSTTGAILLDDGTREGQVAS